MIGESLRRGPETREEWLGPLPVREWFERPERPLEVDLGSGKGRFLLARAAKNPETNFLGIDRMLKRIRKVDNRARRLDLGNVRLMRMEAYYAVAFLLPAGAVHVATDHWPYYEQLAETFAGDGRFAATEPYVPPEDEQTDFERHYLGEKPIGRFSARRI